MANVVVIGSGAAGLRAAIAAHRSGAEVVVVGKRPRLDAHTVLASGGINAALGTRDPEDSWQQHFADTMREGPRASTGPTGWAATSSPTWPGGSSNDPSRARSPTRVAHRASTTRQTRVSRVWPCDLKV